MRSFVSWTDKVQDREGNRQPIYAVSFTPDGNQLLATAGTQVLVYDVAKGDLIQSLKGHRDIVYCLDYAADGKRFASGGADNTVIIWSPSFEGLAKYTHNDVIQALAFNPVTAILVSGSIGDFGIWSPDQKSVPKYKVPARVLSISWTSDGQHFALGLFNGQVSIRNRVGEEKVKIDRGSSPVWALSFSPASDKNMDILCVTDWDQRLAFYQLNGKQLGNNRPTKFDPCTVSYFSTGDFFVIGGGGGKHGLYLSNSEGVQMGTIAERDSWIWSARVRPKQNFVAIGCQDGTISMYQLSFNTVHGLYHDRYAFRENMTDVIIQHLTTDMRARIRCRDVVKKIALYRDRLAVQLSDRIIIYELLHDDPSDLHYRVKEKIDYKLDCNLLVVSSSHIVLCFEKKLHMLTFKGEKEREWLLDAQVRYIKVFGGMSEREGLLVGLRNGLALQLFLDNPFPIACVEHSASIRCLDLSASKTKLAIVDDSNTCFVYDLITKQMLYQEPNATSCAWNSEHDEMLSYSGNGILSIKAGLFAPHQQKMQGFVVGFKGSKVFCLHIYTMTAVDVPQSASMDRYLQLTQFEQAYNIASLGVTNADWRRLGLEALCALDLTVARKCFIRLRDLKLIDLVQHIDDIMSEFRNEPDLYVGEIMLYRGNYQEAAKLFKKANYPQRAIDMYTDLNMWEEATKLAAETASQKNMQEILKRKADMQKEKNDLFAAANTYLDVGDYAQAITLLGDSGAVERLVAVVRSLNKMETEALTKALYYFRKLGQPAYASEVLLKMGDINQLVKVHVEMQNWDEAFRVAEHYPNFMNQIYLPYAQWLTLQERIAEAQIYYRKAGHSADLLKVLDRVIEFAIVEMRWNDASYYYWLKASEHLEVRPITDEALSLYQKDLETAESYYAYHDVHRFIVEPFTSLLPDALFHRARFLLHRSFIQELPRGISLAHILYALGKQAKSLGAYKVARYAFDRLLQLRYPTKWRDDVEVNALVARGLPFTDKEDLMQLCFQCGHINALINTKGDRCSNCQAKNVYSFFGFETLPVVEFQLTGVTDAEFDDVIDTESAQSKKDRLDRWRGSDAGHDSLNLSANAIDAGKHTDADDIIDEVGEVAVTDGTAAHSLRHNLQRQVSGLVGARGSNANVQAAETLNLQNGSASEEDPFYNLLTHVSPGECVQVDRAYLKTMRKSLVLVQRSTHPALPNRYYRIMAGTQSDTAFCKHCKHFFHADDFEFVVLQKGHCPFCRSSTSLNEDV